MDDRIVITIQPGNMPDGTYDVHQPLPYPFHVDAFTGDVDRQDFWQGQPSQVLGFQLDADRQEIDLSWEDAAAYAELIIGMFAVLLDTSGEEGRFYNLVCPITGVTSSKVGAA